jgi:alpha-L-fucosidase 2
MLGKIVLSVALFSVPLFPALQSDIEYGRAGNTPLMLDAFVPDGAGPFPAVIWVHGGGFVAGDKAPYPKTLLDPLVEKGYAWFSVNYRLAPAFPFPAETDDVESAVHFIKVHADQFKIDPHRLVLMGESAGGHLVSFVGASHQPENRVAVVVSFFGEHDLVNRTHPSGPCMVDGKIIPDPGPICLSPGLAKFLGIEKPGPEAEQTIRRASPATYIKPDMPPYLLIHGTKDYNVPIEQSVVMCEAMKRAGARCDLISIEGGGHGRGSLDKAAGTRNYMQEMMEWLKKALQ